MPAERAGYTVTMFVIDVNSTMARTRSVNLPPGPNGEEWTREITNLEWALQFVLLKVQEIIYHNRKTDKCGVVLVGTEDTDNRVHEASGEGYENVTEFLPIEQPTPDTLTKIAALKPTEGVVGDPLDGLIVALQAQESFLNGKKTWTRKLVLVTDGENEMQAEGWKETAEKMNEWEVITSIVGVDFDDEELPFLEENKSEIKRQNEAFWAKFMSKVGTALVGTMDYALQECARPDVKTTKSVLLSTTLRFGNVDDENLREEAISLAVRTSKATAITRPPTVKRFVRKEREANQMDWEGDRAMRALEEFAPVNRRTDYYIEKRTENGKTTAEPDIKVERIDESDLQLAPQKPLDDSEMVEPEELVRAYKYGATYVPFEAGTFLKLETKKGLDICGFILASKFRRDWAMGEVYYIWADINSAREQIALSSIVKAMINKDMVAVTRMTTRDGAEAKMGIAMPRQLDEIECLLWVQMPFADDLRKYTFHSLDKLYNKKGETIEQHPNIPTDEMMTAMDKFVDSMDLMDAGEKDEEGNRYPWFDTIYNYNPALHRVKQALFHAAIVSDLATNPLPPPHPELEKFFKPPNRVVKRTHEALEECKTALKVTHVAPKITAKKKEVGLAQVDEENIPLHIEGAPILPMSLPPAIAGLPPRPQDKGATQTGGDEYGASNNLGDATQQSPYQTSPSHAQELSPPPAAFARGIAPGRIIGSVVPLQDFKRNLSVGDLVTKAVEDICLVLQEEIVKPMANRRRDEFLECLQYLRETCLKEDEIDAWNEFIREFKDVCLQEGENGNKTFWNAVKSLGRGISLISKPEAQAAGGKSAVAEATAVKFIQG